MKYRLLTSEELQELEKEFIDYLVVNGITSDEWQKMKINQIEEAQNIIDLFSDVVWEGVLRNIEYLEIIHSDSVKCFQCLSNKMVLVGMSSSDPDIDFKQEERLFSLIQENHSSIRVYTTEKAYSTNREQELFSMIENGCIPCDGSLFKQLALSL